jgi:hypothetical protein
MLPFNALAVLAVTIAVPLAALMADTFAALMVALLNLGDSNRGSFHSRNRDAAKRE